MEIKFLKSFFVIIFITLIIVACKNEQKNSDTKKEETNPSSNVENVIQNEQKIIFHKVLGFKNISFDITNTGEGSMSQLSIQPKGLTVDNRGNIIEIDGQVITAEIGDLNSDGFPEVLIYTRSVGSGSYGNVIAYSANYGKSISRIYFPEITNNKEAGAGYMGHDEFAMLTTRLSRKFPIYKEGDSNCNPTGGTRQIQYKLEDGEASRVFVIDKISEY